MPTVAHNIEHSVGPIRQLYGALKILVGSTRFTQKMINIPPLTKVRRSIVVPIQTIIDIKTGVMDLRMGFRQIDRIFVMGRRRR